VLLSLTEKTGRKGKAIAKVADLLVKNVDDPLKIYDAMKPKENSRLKVNLLA